MKRRVFTIDQFVAEDHRIDSELDSLVELALLESEKTEEYRNIHKTILFENFGVSTTEDLTFDQKRKYLEYLKESLNIETNLNESFEINESLKEEYSKYFRETLDSMGVKSIAELGDKKSEFFNKLKKGWEKGKGRRSQEVNEADIENEEDFKKWATDKLKTMHGDKFDQEKADEVIDGLIKRQKEEDLDWGVCVGMLNKA